MFSHKKHLFFDLDHTLWDFDKNSAFAFEKIFKTHQIDLPLEDFLKVYIPRNQYYWKLYQKNLVSHENLRYYRIKDVFDALQMEISDELIHQLSEDYILHLPETNHLFDGAIEILDYLQPKYQLHIITNGFSFVQDKKIKKSNLEPYFATITNSETAGQKKPHPSIFEYALQQANATKTESVMIGDSLEADIFGALDFGMDAIYFHNIKTETNGAFLQIHHLEELQKIF